MEETIKHEKSKTHREFEKLLSEDLNNRKFTEGEIATGTIEEIGKKFVFIDLGLKSSGAIPIDEFKLTKEIDKIEINPITDLGNPTNEDGTELLYETERAYEFNYTTGEYITCYKFYNNPILYNIWKKHKK